ncbi:MAG TPA: hypothetical protein PLX54_08490 [Candidatus Fermentibacter daniensis]|jgi:hypothetical protein|nr:MAG: hypothetical protein AO395_02485 [Candidatus Fermentibacter daniensis]KZD19579.1 MAG: hypothetical protein AO394_02205 [Candidatus Fermentibacter daniensis]KZD19741.1 MAG: hypothetical protein AO396_01620 [Candidatus Fermentibacter daniensis]NLI02588.1 hypothetical protein [Candidatus Fermentibacter daniensis]HOA06097.1 hypothetical protein [Candidatus Fermentibacter daniensis]
MWLMTCFGCFSVVRKPGDVEEGMLTVCGRVRADLEALRKTYLKNAGPVIDMERADCRYRMRVPDRDFGEALSRIVDEIDYSDFKSAVDTRQGWARHDIYEQVACVLRQLYCCDQQEKQVERTPV